ncbi:hypothetical protein B0H67DRAFT_648992 [Lasiosphaeris hirsuta]|uniref:Uncharacterized protein n=1 Tax=Lasiosphaeris hirsuta TaxID=260670 RepID=A0AA39ZVS7_9PEZI|nr:hypothetical protein B0H67DRAFT_648992 [Lasiosphaeris hirsuta]
MFSTDDVKDGYISTDSLTGDPVTNLEWRVNKVKHRKFETSGTVTQYLHWANEEKMPYIGFYLRLEELNGIIYAEKSNKIIVRTREISGVEYRGRVLLSFKRNQSKCRLLDFIRDLGIQLLEITPENIATVWKDMRSEDLL